MTTRRRITTVRTAWWLRACEFVGEQPQLLGRPSIWVDGSRSRIKIGNFVRLWSRPVASHFAAGPDAVLDIGDDVVIAHGAAISAFQRIEIGAGTRIGPFVVIMDTNFHGTTGDQSVRHETRPIVIGKNCRIGSRVTITRGASIGDGAEILAGSVVSSAIPSGACAGGARARVFGTAGEAASRWDGTGPAVLELVQVELGLGAAPDLETEPSSLPSWDRSGIARLVAALQTRFAIALDAAVIANASRLADVVGLVERARSTSGRRQMNVASESREITRRRMVVYSIPCACAPRKQV